MSIFESLGIVVVVCLVALFLWTVRKDEEKNEGTVTEAVVTPCKHDHWYVYSTNTIGTGSCLDCGEEVSMLHLFNRMLERMESEIANAKVIASSSDKRDE